MFDFNRNHCSSSAGICSQIGLLLGLEMSSPAFVARFVRACLDEGLIMGWTLHDDTVVRLAPRLVITEAELDEATLRMQRAARSPDTGRQRPSVFAGFLYESANRVDKFLYGIQSVERFHDAFHVQSNVLVDENVTKARQSFELTHKLRLKAPISRKITNRLRIVFEPVAPSCGKLAGDVDHQLADGQ